MPQEGSHISRVFPSYEQEAGRQPVHSFYFHLDLGLVAGRGLSLRRI